MSAQVLVPVPASPAAAPAPLSSVLESLDSGRLVIDEKSGNSTTEGDPPMENGVQAVLVRDCGTGNFKYVILQSTNKIPDWVGNVHPMSMDQRLERVTLGSKQWKQDMECQIFARVEYRKESNSFC